MKILKAYKFRLYPSSATISQLNKTFGCSRFVYNTILTEIKNKQPKSTEKQLKEIHPFLKDVDSIALQQSRINLQMAFKKLKEGNASYPVFKSRKSRQSFRTISTNGNIKIDFTNNTLKLPKMNPIKFRDSRIFTSPIRQVTISRDKCNKYFASILVEEILPEVEVKPLDSSNTVGIDMGVTHYLTLSDGTKITNPKFFVSLQRKLKKIQKKFAKTKKGSKGREKLRLKVAAVHSKIANCRKDFLHKLSSLITKNFEGICIEDLNILGMLKNKRLSKSIQDLGWSEFVRLLEYKAQWAGRTLLKAGRFFPSSKNCNYCNYKNSSLKLSDRVWTCPVCGQVLDRDLNAAINLKNLILSTLGTRGIYASGDNVRLKPAFAGNANVGETRISFL